MKKVRLPGRFFGPQHFQAPMSKAEEEQALLAAIIAGSDDAIFSKTLDTVITSWNRGAERMYGYTAEEAVGQPVSMLVPTDQPDEMSSIMDCIVKGESLDRYETVRKHKDGTLLSVILTISPVRDRKGEIVGASTIARDITAQRLAEDALRASEKLVAMGRMAASIAHELRNPLDAAKNIAYLLQQNENLDASTREMINLLESQLSHMGEICSRTLTFARAGDAVSRVSLAGTVDEVFALQSKNLTLKGIEVARRFESPGEVVGYPGPLRQVLVNLIGNAIDAIRAEWQDHGTHLEPASSGHRGRRCENRHQRQWRRHQAGEPQPTFPAIFLHQAERGNWTGLVGFLRNCRATRRIHSCAQPGARRSPRDRVQHLPAAPGCACERQHTSRVITELRSSPASSVRPSLWALPPAGSCDTRNSPRLARG
jgi:PAS domain S-box-containing protein